MSAPPFKPVTQVAQQFAQQNLQVGAPTDNSPLWKVMAADLGQIQAARAGLHPTTSVPLKASTNQAVDLAQAAPASAEVVLSPKTTTSTTAKKAPPPPPPKPSKQAAAAMLTTPSITIDSDDDVEAVASSFETYDCDPHPAIDQQQIRSHQAVAIAAKHQQLQAAYSEVLQAAFELCNAFHGGDNWFVFSRAIHPAAVGNFKLTPTTNTLNITPHEGQHGNADYREYRSAQTGTLKEHITLQQAQKLIAQLQRKMEAYFFQQAITASTSEVNIVDDAQIAIGALSNTQAEISEKVLAITLYDQAKASAHQAASAQGQTDPRELAIERYNLGRELSGAPRVDIDAESGFRKDSREYAQHAAQRTATQAAIKAHQTAPNASLEERKGNWKKDIQSGKNTTASIAAYARAGDPVFYIAKDSSKKKGTILNIDLSKGTAIIQKFGSTDKKNIDDLSTLSWA